MLKTPKETIIALAKEAGLVFNTECIPGELHKFHRKALYKFSELLEKEIIKLNKEVT